MFHRPEDLYFHHQRIKTAVMPVKEILCLTLDNPHSHGIHIKTAFLADPARLQGKGVKIFCSVPDMEDKFPLLPGHQCNLDAYVIPASVPQNYNT